MEAASATTAGMWRKRKIFFDGGCRPNPGPIEAAVVLRGNTHLFDDLGNGDNADAEWLALICALEVSQAASLVGAEFVGDALPVIRHANALLESRVTSSPREARFLALADVVKPARIRWVKREQNLAGIALAARHPR